MIKFNHSFPSRREAALFCALTLTVCLASGCRKAPEKIDLSSTHTTVAETMAPGMEPPTTPPASVEESESTASGSQDNNISKKLSTKMNAYASGKVSIQYPSVTNMEDSDKAAAIDELIKKNALSVLDAYNIQDSQDALNISCQVLSADRSRITLLYQGTLTPSGADSQNIFYTNTIDVAKASDIGFDHYADPYTMAGYVLSDDCSFYQAKAESIPELTEEKNKTSLDQYTKMFTEADFPFTGSFPQSFSYEHQGIIYFSIPMPHDLGDYAIVMFAPDAK